MEMLMQRPFKEICTRLGISKQQLKRKCVEHNILLFGGDFWKLNSEESIAIGNKTFSADQLQPVVSGRLQGRLIGEIASELQIAYMALFSFFRKYLISPTRLKMQDVQDYLEHVRPGWTLLTEEYLGNKIKIRVRCERSHEFDILPMNLFKNQGCRACNNEKTGLTRERIVSWLANTHPDAKLLSFELNGAYKKVLVECKYGHQFSAAINNLIYNNSWCPICYKAKEKTIENVREWVSNNHLGASVLSDKIENIHDKVKVQCENGHRFEIIVNTLMNKGNWCKFCNRVTIYDLKCFLEKERPGSRLLGEEIKGTNSRIAIQCPKGHIFKPVVRDVYYKDSWCPECKVSISERFTRRIFEKLFGMPFPQTRFSWLTSNKGYPMHLDGYNPALNLAFENNGVQHSQFVKYFHKSIDRFEKRKKDDDLKRRLCKEHGIILVEIPDEIKGSSRIKYIIETCKEYKVRMPEPIPEIDSNEIKREAFGTFYNP